MLFSVSYKSPHKQEADEIKCPYNQLGLLWEFVKDHKDKRYNIVYSPDLKMLIDETLDKACEQIDIIKSAGCEYTVECGGLMALQIMLDKGYSAYWKCPVTDWETFMNLQNLGVSDIYVDGPLGFQQNNLNMRRPGLKIRISPTISPNSSILGAAANSFFVRPEDLSLYEPSVDVIDFNTRIQDTEDALFNIYKRGNFAGKISSLITDLPYDILNPVIPKIFAETRLNCRQICKIPNYSCHHCDNYFSFIKTTVDYLQDSDAT